MHVRELLDALPLDSPAPIYLLTAGKTYPRARESTFETFLAEQAVDRLIECYVDEDNRDFCFTSYHAEETASEQVVAEAETLPFLVERRVVLVRNADRYATESAAKTLLPYLENPAESTVLILVAPRVDKRTKFYKTCEKAGAVVECPMLGERDAPQWASATARDLGKQLDPRAAEELVRRAGLQLSDIHNALTLVANFVGDETDEIREEDVVMACADVAEKEVWGLTDAIAASQSGAAVARLHSLIDMGKHPDELIGTINWLLKTAYQVAEPAAGANVSNFVQKKVQPLTEKLSAAKLRDALALCTDTQFMMRETGVDAPLALELLVIKLSAGRRRRTAASHS